MVVKKPTSGGKNLKQALFDAKNKKLDEKA